MSLTTARERALDVATRELYGTISRTNSSVIGRRGNETVIFATSTRIWTVTAMLSGIRIAFAIEARGLFRKTFHVEGSPMELVSEILDADHLRMLEELQPQAVRLMPNGLRLEQKIGVPDDHVGRAMDVVVSLAGRTRLAQQIMSEPGWGSRRG
jgi:hypothetical protein